MRIAFSHMGFCQYGLWESVVSVAEVKSNGRVRFTKLFLPVVPTTTSPYILHLPPSRISSQPSFIQPRHSSFVLHI
jgi:hypothetical protein